MFENRFARLLKAAGLVGVVLVLAACASAPTRRPLGETGSSADDESVAIARAGTQKPAVVLQAGLQYGKNTWSKLMPQVAAQRMVVATDRPGHGGNPSTSAPRDPCTIAAEQRQLLRQAGVEPPYILVGHSLGGLYQYTYAKLYPQEVAGLVLLDPTHPRHWEAMQRDTPQLADLVKVMRFAAFSRVDKEEFDAQAVCLDRLNMAQPLNLPVRLLFSGRRQPEEKGAFETMLKGLRQNWLGLLGTRDMKVVWDSGHFIQNESPDEVLSAIKQVAAEAAARR